MTTNRKWSEESNGHMTDDTRKVKLVAPICLEPSITKTAWDAISNNR